MPVELRGLYPASDAVCCIESEIGENLRQKEVKLAKRRSKAGHAP